MAMLWYPWTGDVHMLLIMVRVWRVVEVKLLVKSHLFSNEGTILQITWLNHQSWPFLSTDRVH